MKQKADIVVRPVGVFGRDSYNRWGYEIVRVSERARGWGFQRGDAYARRMFSNNQHGKFLYGVRVQVIK